MPLRLSELLDRIRPVGTPGAPAQGEQQRQASDRAREIAAIADLLAGFETEADAITAHARTQADQLRRGADTEIRRLRDAIPDRIAETEATAMQGQAEEDDTTRRALVEATEAEVARLHEQAEQLLPILTTSAIALIWDAAEADLRHARRHHAEQRPDEQRHEDPRPRGTRPHGDHPPGGRR